MNDLQRESTAYHESGHALLQVLAGTRFRYITLRPRNPDVAGQVIVRGSVDRSAWLTEASVLFAGAVAEYLWDYGRWSGQDLHICRKAIVQQSARWDMREARDAVCYAWAMHQGWPEWTTDRIESGWAPVNMAMAAWARAVQLVCTHAEALVDLADLLIGSRRAVTWRQACEVVLAAKENEVTGSYLAMVGLDRPWFLDYSRLRWTPPVEWTRRTAEEAVALKVARNR